MAETAKKAGAGDDKANAPAKPPEPPRPPRLLSWASRRPYLVLTLLGLLLWAPGILSLPALDRDESRFAESSKQMLESGNWVDIRFGQVPRYKKPVGIYWLQAAATEIAGHVHGAGDRHIWTYRLPSLLGALAVLWLTFWNGSLFGAEAGLLAALLMAGTMVLSAEAGMATTDAVQLAAITAMQGVLLRLYRGPISRKLALAGWAALAVGIMVKGPVAPAVAAVTILALALWQWRSQRWRAFAWLKGSYPRSGVALLLVIVLPWLVAIGLASRGAFFQQSLGGDFAAKVAGGQEGHGQPPGFYLLISAAALWPAVLFLLPGLWHGIGRRTDKAIGFLLCWAGASWAMMEAVPTKLPNYILPALPPLAILAALWLLAPTEPEKAPAPSILSGESGGVAVPEPAWRRFAWRRIFLWTAAVQFAVGLGLAAAGPVLLPRLYGEGDVPALMALAALVGLAGLVALILFALDKRLGAMAAALLASLILVPGLTTLVAPRLDRLWVSQQVAALVKKDSRQGDPPPVLAGYEEPSLVFLLGAHTGLSDGAGAAEAGARDGGLALVDDAERPKFLARLAELQADATALDEVSGFNYSRGRQVHITLYRVTALDPEARPRPIE